MKSIQQITLQMILSIDGNIGAGKTTLVEALKQAHPDWVFVDEPVNQWMTLTDEKERSLLSLFYEDSDKWGFAFQMYALLTRTIALRKAIESSPKDAVIVTERCYQTDFHVFATMMYDDKKLDLLQWKIYKGMYDELIVGIPIHHIVYLTCSADTCDERIHIRNRKGEESIPLNYLQQLDHYHHTWLRTTDTPNTILCTEDSISMEYKIKQIEEIVSRTV
jgi:deoxyadenosine/deoxycytidine kinase